MNIKILALASAALLASTTVASAQMTRSVWLGGRPTPVGGPFAPLYEVVAGAGPAVTPAVGAPVIPVAVARSSAGFVFVSDVVAPPQIFLYTNADPAAAGPAFATLPAVAAAGFLAADPINPANVWAAAGATLSSYSFTVGGVVATVALPAAVSDLELAPGGQIWALTGALPLVTQLNVATATFVQVPIALPGTPALDMAVDSTGTAWITDGTATVRRFDAMGNLLSTAVLPEPVVRVRVDACNVAHFAPDGPGVLATVIHRVLPNGVQLTPVALGSPTNVNRFHLDTDGNIWVEGSVAGIPLTFAITAGGASMLTIQYPAGVVPGTNGDVTGLQMSAIAQRGLDVDIDGTTSAVELLRGSDPQNAADVPPMISVTQNLTNPMVLDILYTDTTAPGMSYQLAASTGNAPGIALGDPRFPTDPPKGCPVLPLVADPIFNLSLVDTTIFVGFTGVLSGVGTATASVNVPPGATGLPLFFGGLNLSGLEARTASSVVAVLP